MTRWDIGLDASGSDIPSMTLDIPVPMSAHMINVWGIGPGVDGISHGSVGEPEFVRHGLCASHSDRLPLIAPPPAKAASVDTACCGSPVT